MSFRNTTRSWGSLSKALHWTIVLLIILQWVIIERAEDQKLIEKVASIGWHKSFGITVLMLAVIRLAWRWLNPVPDMRGDTQPWERVLAKLAHVLLYALIFALPVTGWMMSSAKNIPVSWFKLFQLPDLVGPSKALADQLHEVHETLFTVLVVVAVVHALGALKHHFIDKNDVLRRMLPFSRVE